MCSIYVQPVQGQVSEDREGLHSCRGTPLPTPLPINGRLNKSTTSVLSICSLFVHPFAHLCVPPVWVTSRPISHIFTPTCSWLSDFWSALSTSAEPYVAKYLVLKMKMFCCHPEPSCCAIGNTLVVAEIYFMENMFIYILNLHLRQRIVKKKRFGWKRTFPEKKISWAPLLK
jgi:hypothetical protein